MLICVNGLYLFNWPVFKLDRKKVRKNTTCQYYRFEFFRFKFQIQHKNMTFAFSNGNSQINGCLFKKKTQHNFFSQIKNSFSKALYVRWQHKCTQNDYITITTHLKKEKKAFNKNDILYLKILFFINSNSDILYTVNAIV